VVAVLPHPSIAVKVLVCDLEQDVLIIVPSEELTVGPPHASVAVAEPNAPAISEAWGLHPKATVVNVPVNVGATRSLVQLTVFEVVVVLPHPSIAVNVLV
jgi:hypothetical protein